MNLKLKTFALFFVCLMLIFSISVAAVSDIKIDVGKDFYVLSRNPEKVYDILGQTKEELRDYCNSQGIVYFAVNRKGLLICQNDEIIFAIHQQFCFIRCNLFITV